MSSQKIFQADTLIIGAGVIGSSVAMHLARLGARDIHVIDFDLEGPLSSSELNAGAVRATLTQPINIRMSQLTIDYFASVSEEVGYRPVGYLWLHTEERMANALKARERQIAMGWPVEALDVPELKRRAPLVDKTDGIAGAMFAPKDGLVNPNRVKNHFRTEAKELGVVFHDRLLLRSAEHSRDEVKCLFEKFPLVLSHDAQVEVLCGKLSLEAKRIEYRAKRVINCAGAWAAEVARILGYSCPSVPVRRQVCLFDCRDADLTPYGMIVDTSGVYFHPEATNGLAGFANNDEPHGVNYEYDGEAFFMERIWPALYERSTAFERLKHLTGWAGLYEVSPDECAIMGKPESDSNRLYEAHSFSGHGVMHSYAAGLALAELVVKGKYETVDASVLSAKRFETGELIREGLVI